MFDPVLAGLAAFALPTTCPACGTGTEGGFCPPRVIHWERVRQAFRELSLRTTDAAQKRQYDIIIERMSRNAAGTVMRDWEWEALVADRRVPQMAPSRRKTQPYPIVGSGRDFRR